MESFWLIFTACSKTWLALYLSSRVLRDWIYLLYKYWGKILESVILGYNYLQNMHQWILHTQRFTGVNQWVDTTTCREPGRRPTPWPTLHERNSERHTDTGRTESLCTALRRWLRSIFTWRQVNMADFFSSHVTVIPWRSLSYWKCHSLKKSPALHTICLVEI